MTEKEKNRLNKLIGEGNIKETFSQLKDKDWSENQRKSILSIFSRYNRLKRESQLGTINHEQEKVSENKIISQLIDFIDDPESAAASGRKIRRATLRTEIWIIAFLAVVSVIILFWVFVPSNKSNEVLQLTIFITDTKGNVVLEHEGELNIRLGNRSLNESVGEDGRINFPDIIPENNGDTITHIGLKAEGWELAAGQEFFVFEGKPIHLIVKRDKSLATIKGVVKSRDGQQFIADAQVRINNDTTILTDEQGIFKIVLPEEMQVTKSTDQYILTIEKGGYEVLVDYYSPRSSDAEIRLNRLN